MASLSRNSLRPTARERGYDSRWDRERRAFLAANPRCAMCLREGLATQATVVDHVIPHRGDARLFWDRANWQGLCRTHHSADKQQQERSGFSARVDSSGLPVDREHPFYAGDAEQGAQADARQRPRQAWHAGSRKGDRGSTFADPIGVGPAGEPRTELVSPRGRGRG